MIFFGDRNRLLLRATVGRVVRNAVTAVVTGWTGEFDVGCVVMRAIDRFAGGFVAQMVAESARWDENWPTLRMQWTMATGTVLRTHDTLFTLRTG